ncbi:hypothetical protein GGQ03_000587 [Salinibacter ruber]|jgi:hypothetical protein|nr:hypothetical protein [Salinibacter ruber]MCS4153330.1 hypothetical protein [Salinibacter ruber]
MEPLLPAERRGGTPFADWAEEDGGWTVEVVHKAEDGSFRVLPRW